MSSEYGGQSLEPPHLTRQAQDYLTISWLFFRCGLSLPHIIAGANLNVPVVGPALQKCGAAFIRRSFGDDALYPTVVNEYMHQLLAQGKNIECFCEGTRSRTGKLLPPKLGILKYIVEGLQRGVTEDCWICPISLQYDKVGWSARSQAWHG